jgi:PiT family inorganic phosphate transporter
MVDMASHGLSVGGKAHKPRFDHPVNPLAIILFVGLLAAGLLYVVYSLYADVAESGTQTRSILPFLLLGVALMIALGFEFVNGFHDTANAVATVIYTHSLAPPIAVVWSGVWNFLGVLTSSGLVAFGIVSLLPVELILKVGSDAGFAMVFALLIAAILWNIGTWYFGLPNSSSHTLIGSIIGVGLMNQLMAPAGSGTSGVDWSQALGIAKSLIFSPIVGFVCAALLFTVLKFVVRSPQLYQEPKGDKPPPLWIRGLLILTCTGVSFAHGSNDGQKGMGLIMLILIGTVPTAYALNRALPDSQIATFTQAANKADAALKPYGKDTAASPDARAAVASYIQTQKFSPDVVPAFTALSQGINAEVSHDGNLSRVPTDKVQNVRNDMYLESEAIRMMLKADDVQLDGATKAALGDYRKQLDNSTKFIPTWVKVAVAIALGLGTMIGWKRIVVTVGEKIGKQHMSYAQGASAELVAMATIAAADQYGLPVSTTHVLSSGVAGAMTANGSGLQAATIRNMVLAWVLTLPAAIILSGVLFFIFRHIF